MSTRAYKSRSEKSYELEIKMLAAAREKLESQVRELTAQLENLQDIKGVQINTDRGEVWYWQGDGHDFPESLTCPVIMKAETVRELRATVASRIGARLKEPKA